MGTQFFEQPILNSPYAYPGRHWELDADGQPTNIITESRRKSAFITPVPKPKKRRRGDGQKQVDLVFPEPEGISTAEQQYDPNTIINEIRGYVDQWRKLPNPDQWQVTPETARLLQHWRSYPFQDIRPFFCQLEAIETAIWLTEVAPHQSERGRKFLDYLKSANAQANPEIFRIALKLATGAGKTTVIAMLVAWQTLNAVRRPASKTFTRGFLIVTPGITIRDRLRVVLPSDPDNYYEHRELVPADLLGEVKRAKIVITNFHAFKLRERLDVSKVGRALLKGRGPELETTETEGQMIQRVMPDLMGLKSVLVINDEAHHCYRHKVAPAGEEDEELDAEAKEEAEKNSEAARLWISGIEAVKRKLDVRTVFDLSATPFYIGGSGYPEGSPFPWIVSDFGLVDAIESGITKIPRLPAIDNDLAETDITFGFNSAVNTAAEAIDRLYSTAEAHLRVMVIELMGNNAGWLALTAGLAGGADIILIPEIPYDIESICQHLTERRRRGKWFSIIAVAEGARPKPSKADDDDADKNGKKKKKEKDKEKKKEPRRKREEDSDGRVSTGVAKQISRRLGMETRVTVLGHLQRGGIPTPFDRVLATRFGTYAAEMLSEGKYNQMVCMKGAEVTSVPLEKVAGRTKLVPLDHPLIRSARRVGTNFGD